MVDDVGSGDDHIIKITNKPEEEKVEMDEEEGRRMEKRHCR